MRNHPSSRRAALLLATAMLLLFGAMPVHAASAIDIEARALVGGNYEVGGWVAVAVNLANDGEATEGYLESTSDGGTVRRFVEMPAGANKATTLYVQPEAFDRRVTVRYVEPNGTVSADVDVRVFEESGSQVAVVGDTNGTLRPQLTSAIGADTPDPISIGIGDLPERPEPLAGITALVWAGDSSALGEGQRRAIERWVADGGELVVVGGPDWQARAGGFTDLLPLETLTAEDGVSHAALASWAGSEAPPVAEESVSTGALREGSRAVVESDDGTVLVSMRSVGAGSVILVGTDMATEAYRAWEGAPRLWSRLLPAGTNFEDFFGGGLPPRDEAENAISQALGSLPSLDVPPAELLLALIVAYILLIGPISYIVLRRLDRRELAWVTAPLLVVLFAGCSFGIGSALKGGDVIVNQISLLRSSGDGTTATVESYAGIFSPQRTSYDLAIEADALVSQLRPNNGQPANERTSNAVIEQGNPAQVRDLAIGVFGFEGVRADAVVEHSPAISVSWQMDDGTLVGTVTNNGEAVVSDVAYISRSQAEMIGDLDPGTSAEFTLGAANVNGSSASDQVYGFAGFDPADGAQRETVIRRQVIDSLVGFGGFAGHDAPTQSGRGPFVIGWVEAEGPMPITIDELVAQRYTSSVEVISVRPAATSGEVTIRPLQMRVSIVESEGDVQHNGSGVVTLGEGSVTYAVSLPLEATSMAVESIEVIVGSDPTMVAEQGGGGFWPEGYTAEILDQATGRWTELGDLSAGNRFQVEDPARVTGETGRLDVRVVGVGFDPNFGPSSVFVSAEVSGVIDA